MFKCLFIVLLCVTVAYATTAGSENTQNEGGSQCIYWSVNERGEISRNDCQLRKPSVGACDENCLGDVKEQPKEDSCAAVLNFMQQSSSQSNQAFITDIFLGMYIGTIGCVVFYGLFVLNSAKNSRTGGRRNKKKKASPEEEKERNCATEDVTGTDFY